MNHHGLRTFAALQHVVLRVYNRLLSSCSSTGGVQAPLRPSGVKTAALFRTHSGATVRGELGVVPTARIPSTHVPGPLCIPFTSAARCLVAHKLLRDTPHRPPNDAVTSTNGIACQVVLRPQAAVLTWQGLQVGRITSANRCWLPLGCCLASVLPALLIAFSLSR